MDHLRVWIETPSGSGNPGVSCEFRICAQNVSERALGGTISLQPPLCAKSDETMEFKTGILEPGADWEREVTVKFLYGGRTRLYCWEKEAQMETFGWAVFDVKGAGYYSGDTHAHSSYSDGKSSLDENRTSMLDKGHSFLYSTEHNTLDHLKEIEAFARTQSAERFLHAAGWEYTTRCGHAVTYFTAGEPYPPEIQGSSPNLARWQRFVDEITSAGGLVFLAHPYEAPCYEFGDGLLMNIDNIAGIEVWNGFNYHALNSRNRRAFSRWDRINARGVFHCVGNAVSDAHTAKKHGNPFIKGYLKELNADCLREMLENGRFFGSNGPELYFRMDEFRMGETLYINEERKTVKVGILLFDPAGRIEKIVLYRGGVNTSGQENPVKAVAEASPSSANERRRFEVFFELTVSHGEFYRVEAFTEFGAVAFDPEARKQEAGFAFTNPIWIERM
ncbi:MAG: CehA/McbA family metallohydrolase [Synergistaceae bacterium]|jgi:predicted metal-dependent phosphoesterase TrpH|nr:CehA/McbA family metallohydrolase [Synergistaceae bacterium]